MSTTSASNNHTTTTTYEVSKAQQSCQAQPDKIHWSGHAAFRDAPYRQLHHQRGLIGVFRVRLLEASNLQRRYWSALALGPVKHLGLSKAHGAVSSFCTFSLQFSSPYDNDNPANSTNKTRPVSAALRPGDGDRKPAAKKHHHKKSQQQQHQPKIVSPVVHADNNPVWENCEFDFPLKKGAMSQDGMTIQLTVRVEEDATAVETMLPGIPADSRLLGTGTLNLHELCLGERTADGQVLPGVLDAWIPISLQKHNHDDDSDSDSDGELPYSKDDPLAPPVKQNKLDHHHHHQDDEEDPITGMVRVLVSYTPVGLEPQPADIVALEAFARRNVANGQATCRPLLPPLQPLTVLERRGAYLLCEYLLPDHRKACVRLHRNAVFCIERQNWVDAAHNLALLPVDVVLSTPVGQAAVHALGPVATAARELCMPALLSLRLVWVAGRTTTLASLSGVQALGGTLWSEGSSSLTASHRPPPPPIRRNNNSGRSAATAQYVQL